MKRFILIAMILAILVSVGGTDVLEPPVARADGFIDFEDGVDGEPIGSSIPGLQFTTTEGYDWIYGDWRTGGYNGPYPDGVYYSNGNFFAWLGPNQGAGRIDFTEGCATYLQVWVSSAYGLTADAYYSDHTLAATASVEDNLSTGQLARLRVDAPPGDCFSYVILHDTGNYWLIDDLSTDAGGVPVTRPPVIILPGLTGSRLNNNDTCWHTTYEVWPAVADMILDPFDAHLEHLKLAENGSDPASSCDHISPNGIIRNVSVFDVYGPLIDYLELVGFNVYTYDYDWRLDLRDTADKLDDFVDDVLIETGADQVNVVDHSLGGLLARYYVTSDPTRAAKVEQVISLGTPFLGAPKSLKALRWGDTGLGFLWGLIGLYAPRTRDLAQNSPAMYQILPTDGYFDVYGSGYYRVDGQMKNRSQTRFVILSEHNTSLALDAEDFHSDAVDDWGSTQLDVAFRLIVGSGQEDTPGVLHERTIFDWRGCRIITWDIEPTNGDGTVPLHSADLQGNGYDYSGGVPIWYTNDLDHGSLIKTSYVMQFIGAMLATPPSTSAMARAHASMHLPDPSVPSLYRGSLDRFSEPKHHVNVPPTPPEMADEPFELDGGQIAAFGAVALHVYDEFGNHTGLVGNDCVELGIPGSGYTVMGDAVFVTVPTGGTYTIEVESNGAKDFDLKIRNIEGLDTSLIQRTVVYADAPVGSKGSAELTYDPDASGPPPEMALDTDGDGTFDDYMPPTGDLGPEDSYDMVAPTVTVNLDGEIGPYGWYIGNVIVTITATDDQSGLAKVDYSTNFGQSVQEYAGPFTVQAEQVSLLIAEATDYAGNEGWTTTRIGPSKTYLPIVVKSYTRGADWRTIMTENFEGTFPSGKWSVADDNGTANGEYYWDGDDYKPHQGSYSAWPANGGANALDPQYADYPNNLDSWMIYGSFDLSAAADAELLFHYWNQSEQGYDYLFWGASVNGTSFYGSSVSGDSGGWQAENFDLTNVYTLGDLTGQSAVWIAFVFISDSSITDKGAFVDDIVLRKSAVRGASTESPAVVVPEGLLRSGAFSLSVGSSPPEYSPLHGPKTQPGDADTPSR
jgi:pimeloyl-ACP methyl ester carboxylesterase